MENSNAVIPKSSAWSQSLTRGGPSQKVTSVAISPAKFWCFGWVVAYERWSHMEVRQYLRIFLFSQRWVCRRGMRQFGERVSMELSDSHQNGH